MEKLQTAIEKARAQRQKRAGSSAKAPGPADTAPVSSDVAARWAALKPVTIPQWAQRHNRLVAYTGGHKAGAIDMLRTRILQQAYSNEWKSVALVSPHAGCGKTTLAANLAFSFGRRSDFRTMVLDLDMRRPALAQTLGLTPEHTMADVLQGRIAFADHGVRHGDNVALGLNRGPVETSSEILQTRQTRDVLAEIRAAYTPDIILLDMPPLQEADDNFGFLNSVDSALLIAEAEHTTISQIDMAERQIAEMTNVMGVVLNKCRYADDGYGYGYQ